MSTPPDETRGDDERPEEGPDPLVRAYVRLRDLLSRSTTNVLPYTRTVESRQRAAERLRFLGRVELPDLAIERPPLLPDFQQLADVAPPESDRLLHRLRLRREQRFPQLALLGRVGDALISLLEFESAVTPSVSFEDLVLRTHPAVALKPVPRLLLRTRPRLFPWRVEVRTTDPDFIAHRFDALGEWLGIGVDVVGGEPVHALDRCHQPGGLYGTIGGVLRAGSGADAQLTCAHVLAPACGSLVWRSPIKAGAGAHISDHPDAALVASGSPCFTERKGPKTPLVAASFEQLCAMLADGSLVERGARRRHAQGHVVQAPGEGARVSSPELSVYPDGAGGVNRFPAVVVVPRRRRFGPLQWPLIPRPFSIQGDSGSWVIDRHNRVWIGMVMSGQRGMSYALSADHLCAYLRELGEIDEPEARTWLT